ncbi:Ltp family lipoprotein [Eubacteriales bacterium DFI.9.88]|nr:Ltp family lipoprotein [Eubacteriales bacterium DFI.9.88]
MKKCLQCGTEADTNFCPNCGSEMKEVPHLFPERSKTTSDIEPTIPSTPRPGQVMKAKKPIYKRVWFIILVIIVVLGIVGCFASGDENTGTASTPTEATPSTTMATTEAPATTAATESTTLGEKNALQKAKDYLMLDAGFSKKGLKEQLEFEGFTDKQAAHGAKSVGY